MTGTKNRLATGISACTLFCILATCTGKLYSQQATEIGSVDPMVNQLVDSRKGFIARIPTEAVIDSSQSGWNPELKYEQRVYRIEGAGEIRFTTQVGPQLIPDTVTRTTAYTYLLTDSSTAYGTAYIKTYYMPTRSVRIEIIPYGTAMHGYIKARETIFNSFRWKPGANSTAFDVDPNPNKFPLPEPVKMNNSGR